MRLMGVALLGLVLGAGCVPQSEECIQYIDCQVHYEEALSLPETDTNRFKPDGVCWENDSLATDCTATCVGRMAQYVVDLEEADEDVGPCENLLPATDAGVAPTDGGS